MTQARSVVIVTGISGAGKTTALKAFEDLGFEVIDNLPLSLLRSLFKGIETSVSKPLVIGIDSRTRDFNATDICDFCTELEQDTSFKERIVFLDCDDDKLLRRFTETRRSHPLAHNKTIREGLLQERSLLSVLREQADDVIDTTDLNAGDLRRYIEHNFGVFTAREMIVSLISFSYRQGIPREADLVFDVRFLTNPHYEHDLRPLTGESKAVGDYIAKDPDFDSFFKHLTDFLAPLFPRFYNEGKSCLTIAFGCTGGKHRSVYLTERLYAWLLDKKQYILTKAHRELDKEALKDFKI